MIRISNIRFPVSRNEDELENEVKKEYKIQGLSSFEISKKSVDARKKSDVHYIYSVNACCKNERELVKRYRNIAFYTHEAYEFPKSAPIAEPIVIAGFGPAGMLCALMLVKNGHKVIVLERGKRVEERMEDVESFINGGALNENSNVQFGEGGAGTFSDGKLTTGISDKRIDMVLKEFYSHGAPKEILYLAKPHIGTDNLCRMVKSIREDIIASGGEILFSSALTDIEIENGRVEAVIINGKQRIKTHNIVLATGHSARDTFSMLKERGVKMEQKPFSIGVRIEHKQSDINYAQYGEFAKYLPPADYKLNVKTASGRGVYTFCMCPGGSVIASASEERGVVTNGMSNFLRSGENANSALLVNIYPSDLDGSDPLSGMYLQRAVENRGFCAAGKDYSAVCETVGHLYGGENKTDIVPSYKPLVKFGKISDVLPEYVVSAIKDAIPRLDKKLSGFGSSEAVMTAPETRSSSPVRILRDTDTLMASVEGLYPCGEGAGYAGGITSAAVDGIRVAEAVQKRNRGQENE